MQTKDATMHPWPSAPPPQNPNHERQLNGSELQRPAALDPGSATVVSRTVVVHPPHAIGADENRFNAVGSGAGERKKLRIWARLLVIGTVAVIVIPVVLLRKKWWFASSEEREQVALPPTSPAPTARGDDECRVKRIKITDICNASGLDDDLVELKILVNDRHYWPKQVESDCLDAYGSEGLDSCVVPNSSLAGTCFPLRNSIELLFGGGDGAPIGEQIKVTLYDTDFFWDDTIEIFVPKGDWYQPNSCEKRELEFAEHAREGSAKIKMVVDFGEVETACGVEEEALISGLGDAAVALENVRLGLIEYARETEEPGRRRGRRRLFLPFLAVGFRAMAGAVATGGRSFVKLFTRQTRVGNALSTTADMTEIGSFLLSIIGKDGGSSSNISHGNNDNEVLFDKVFDRFDQIDSQLDSIQGKIRDGFEEIKLVVEGEFAEQELDEWITFRLGIKLRGDYLGYTDRSHTSLSRSGYEETFRQTCNGDHSPYNIFQVLYSFSCLDCQLFSGKAHQYFLDTYVNLANANFEDQTERVLWFRRSFGTVIIGALTESIYFYTVCLHRAEEDGCEVIDPVWDARLEEMGDALEEVVASLGEAEMRLE